MLCLKVLLPFPPETPSNSAELQWASQKEANGANDDWSGFGECPRHCFRRRTPLHAVYPPLAVCVCVCALARAAPADPSSDWYAPVEHWGNYEGVAAMAAPPRKPEPAAAKVSPHRSVLSSKFNDQILGFTRLGVRVGRQERGRSLGWSSRRQEKEEEEENHRRGGRCWRAGTMT